MPRLAEQVTALAVRDRQAMAAVLLEEALRITTGRGCRLVERMAAAQAAHRVRGDLADRSALLGVQRELAAALEALGEPAAALEVATAALEDWPPGSSAGDRDWLAAGPPRSWTGTGRRGRAGPAPTIIRPKKLKSEFNSRGRAWQDAAVQRAHAGRRTVHV